MTDRYLEDLEQQLVPEVEDRLEAEWLAFTEGRFDGAIFTPARARPCPGALEWPAVSVNQAQADLDAMVLQQYGGCALQLARGSGGMLGVDLYQELRSEYEIIGADVIASPARGGTKQSLKCDITKRQNVLNVFFVCLIFCSYPQLL